MKLLRLCSLWLTLTGVAWSADVYSVKFGFTGATQDEVGGQPAIQSIKGTATALVNIARGRAPDATVPANEVLAAVLDCSSALGLIVYDTTSHSNLVTVIPGTPPGPNSLDDGFLVFTGKASLDTNGCPTKLSASVTGVIDATFTDDVGTHSGTILVMKGKLTLGTKLGTLSP